jgi:hypothetical protein
MPLPGETAEARQAGLAGVGGPNSLAIEARRAGAGWGRSEVRGEGVSVKRATGNSRLRGSLLPSRAHGLMGSRAQAQTQTQALAQDSCSEATAALELLGSLVVLRCYPLAFLGNN